MKTVIRFCSKFFTNNRLLDTCSLLIDYVKELIGNLQVFTLMTDNQFYLDLKSIYWKS